jgi:hypothetical protein
VLHFLFSELFKFLACLLQGLNNLFVSLLLIHLLLLLGSVLLLRIRQLILQLLYNIKVCVCDLLVVVLDISIFACMFGS